MSKTDDRPIEVGDRFLSKDRRDRGRIVEVVEHRVHFFHARDNVYTIRTEVHPHNPNAVGRIIPIKDRTLRAKFERVSR